MTLAASPNASSIVSSNARVPETIVTIAAARAAHLQNVRFHFPDMPASLSGGRLTPASRQAAWPRRDDNPQRPPQNLAGPSDRGCEPSARSESDPALSKVAIAVEMLTACSWGLIWNDGELRSWVAVMRVFPDDAAAEAWFVKARWPEGIRCPFCDSDQVKEGTAHKTMPYRCGAAASGSPSRRGQSCSPRSWATRFGVESDRGQNPGSAQALLGRRHRRADRPVHPAWRAWLHPLRQRPGVRCRGRQAVDRRGRRPHRLHRARLVLGERLHRELQRQAP